MAYYLYRKAKSVALPKFNYSFSKFEDFYDTVKVLTASLTDSYKIRIKSDSYADIVAFIRSDKSYSWVDVYIETSQALIDYISLRIPSVSLLTSKSNYETFLDLISRYGILFKRGCIDTMYMAIDHTYESMVEALELVKQEFPNVTEISDDELNKLFVIDKLVYPRTVCIDYIRMTRWRKSRLDRCLKYFGNDLVFYAIRKNCNTFLNEKIKYLKTGNGNGLIKLLPYKNIVLLQNALNAGRAGSRDISTILSLYEGGNCINDIIQERTVSYSDAECNALR